MRADRLNPGRPAIATRSTRLDERDPMTQQTVAITTDTDESPYARLAAELRLMADDLDTITGQPAPGYTAFDIQPNEDRADDAKTMAAVDAVATTLLDRTGELQKMSGGGCHYHAMGHRGPIRVSVYQGVTDPERQKLAAELEQLRAELAEARAATANAEAHLGTNGAVADAKPDTLLVAHTGRTVQDGAA
jgi:uncharacterized membrane protein YccC